MQTDPMPIQSLAQVIDQRIHQRRRDIVRGCVEIALFGVALSFIAAALWQFYVSMTLIAAGLLLLIFLLIGAFDWERPAVERARAEVRALRDQPEAYNERWRQAYSEFQQKRSTWSIAFLRAIELEPAGEVVTMVVPLPASDAPGLPPP